jgi:hypothetical protein
MQIKITTFKTARSEMENVKRISHRFLLFSLLLDDLYFSGRFCLLFGAHLRAERMQ